MTDYKTLYISLFSRIAGLTEEITEESDAADAEAESFYLKLQQIMLDTEEQYVTLMEK